MNRALLFLLPIIYLTARMTVEWLWFSQFEWEAVVLDRWLLQLLFGFIALLPVWIAQRCREQLCRNDAENPHSHPWLAGNRFSVVLLVCFTAMVGSCVLMACLMFLAISDPFALEHWHQAIAVPESGMHLVIPICGLLCTMAVLQRRSMRWLGTSVGLAMIVIVARAWGLWALAMNIPASGFRDAVLHSDSSFALAQFAALRLAVELILLLVVFNLSAAVWEHLTGRNALTDWRVNGFGPENVNQLRRWSATILILGAGWIWLSRHQLLWTANDVLAGAGWLQTHLTLPFRTFWSYLCLAIAAYLLASSYGLRVRGLKKAIPITIAVLITLEYTMTPLINWLWLRPQELSLQTPYIEEAIRLTRHAFQLDKIVKNTQNPSQEITRNDLFKGASTLLNVRLWDTQPLLESNSQLQQLRVFYKFSNAAVDRYPLLPDERTSQQVILAAREMDQSELPWRSRSWLNRHFVFSHGYGFTVSPVNAFSSDGLPAYFISDLGSATTIEGNKTLGITTEDVKAAVPVDRSALYFGTLRSPYVVAPTEVAEFDYPEGDDNVYSRYDGSGGIPVGSIWQRLAAATYLFEPRLLTTPAIKAETKLLLRREVRQRVHALAPFLDLRGDPYLVSVPMNDNVRGYEPSQSQYWIVEGYTNSTSYPYSSVVEEGGSERYLRNAVKIVVDAYNGSVHFYISEPDDPLIQGWAKVFPQMFEPIEAMPFALREHLRVPVDLFNVQVNQLQRYHVTEPRKFYSGDDVWQVPIETYGRERVPVKPYHITAQVEGREDSEFLLLQPLTPLARPNLNAWLAARNDGDHYGELLLIEFPRDTAILGPEQVQALINQEPEISRLFGLWDRAGSEVLQGNLLVVPVGRSLLYVEPVYLRAEKGGLPSLARIVVSDGRDITMGTTLREAIANLLKKPSSTEASAEGLNGLIPKEI